MKPTHLILSGIFTLVLLGAMIVATEPKEILLWPNGAPGSEEKTDPEKMRVTDQGDIVLSSVHKPSITPYIPTAQQSTGVAVIVIPGGGHSEIWISHEGYNPARWLMEHGIAAFVLKYRLAKEKGSTYTVDKNELADVQRAIRLVRNRATEWHIDTSKIGAIGFSAGGELAGLSAMRFSQSDKNAVDPVDRESDRPNFQGLIYPGNLNRLEITKASPPAFTKRSVGILSSITPSKLGTACNTVMLLSSSTSLSSSTALAVVASAIHIVAPASRLIQVSSHHISNETEKPW